LFLYKIPVNCKIYLNEATQKTSTVSCIACKQHNMSLWRQCAQLRMCRLFEYSIWWPKKVSHYSHYKFINKLYWSLMFFVIVNYCALRTWSADIVRCCTCTMHLWPLRGRHSCTTAVDLLMMLLLKDFLSNGVRPLSHTAATQIWNNGNWFGSKANLKKL